MADPNTEIELKLQIPATALKAVTRAVNAGKVQRTRLQAVYYDTADRRLASAGIAVRIRREGDKWVQTAKAGDPHAMTRHEHNVPLTAPPKGTLPALDLNRHAGTRAGELIEAALPKGSDAVEALYRTDIERTHRVARVAGGRIELALDIGSILAADREWPVCELEIELVSGHPDAVIDTARQWSARHGLWLDTRSKAERGDRLARNATTVRAVKAAATDSPADSTARQACHNVLLAGLAHVLPNLSEVASGDHSADHVHQLRTALRHLRTALDLFDDIASGPGDGVRQVINEARHDLGVTRDQDAIAAAWAPALEQAGAPVALPRSDGAQRDAVDIARRPALTGALLAVQSWCVADGTLGPRHADFPEALADRLDRWHKRLTRSARQYEALDTEARHKLRRRIKRLKDALGLTRFLFRKKPLKAAMATLDQAQASLGKAHDLVVAIDACRSAAAKEPGLWFAVGWLTAQRESANVAAAEAVAELAHGRPLRAGKALR